MFFYCSVYLFIIFWLKQFVPLPSYGWPSFLQSKFRTFCYKYLQGTVCNHKSFLSQLETLLWRH